MLGFYIGVVIVLFVNVGDSILLLNKFLVFFYWFLLMIIGSLFIYIVVRCYRKNVFVFKKILY